MTNSAGLQAGHAKIDSRPDLARLLAGQSIVNATGPFQRKFDRPAIDQIVRYLTISKRAGPAHFSTLKY